MNQINHAYFSLVTIQMNRMNQSIIFISISIHQKIQWDSNEKTMSSNEINESSNDILYSNKWFALT
jgi:hypothetical protein